MCHRYIEAFGYLAYGKIGLQTYFHDKPLGHSLGHPIGVDDHLQCVQRHSLLMRPNTTCYDYLATQSSSYAVTPPHRSSLPTHCDRCRPSSNEFITFYIFPVVNVSPLLDTVGVG